MGDDPSQQRGEGEANLRGEGVKSTVLEVFRSGDDSTVAVACSSND